MDDEEQIDPLEQRERQEEAGGHYCPCGCGEWIPNEGHDE